MLFDQMQEGSAAPSIGLQKDPFVCNVLDTKEGDPEARRKEEVNSRTQGQQVAEFGASVWLGRSKVVVDRVA